MATGIIIRAVAPLLESKLTDPAVIGVDATGKFVISLLSGHYGGANELARIIAAGHRRHSSHYNGVRRHWQTER